MKKHLVSIVIPLRVNKSGVVEAWLQKRVAATFTGLLEFPGGKIEAGETSAQAGAREFLEEVGVALSQDSMVYFKHYHTQYPDREFFINSFIVKGDDLSLNQEGWFKLDENLKEQSLPGNKIIIDDLIKFSSDGVSDSLWKSTSLQ